jgi:hypothetical protein
MNREEFELRKLDHHEEYLFNLRCPTCGANWQAIKESLSGDGLDRETALAIVNNCKTCWDHFDYMLPAFSELELMPIGGCCGIRK